MIWLAAHMWFLLFTSFAIGLGIGCWIWGARRIEKTPSPQASDTGMGSLDGDGSVEKGDL